MNPDRIGWLASVILIATLTRQIVKQNRSADEGVSRWLFVGQCAASAGFVVYSVRLENRVFIVTNGCALLTATVGPMLTLRGKRAWPDTGDDAV